MRRTKKADGTRKFIVGGCRKCRTDPAENHGRGLCGVCYGEEYDAGRWMNWPKLAAGELCAAPPPAPAPQPVLPLGPVPPGKVTAINVLFEGEDLKLFDHLAAEAKEQRRSLGQHVLWYLDGYFNVKARTALGAAASSAVGHA